MPAKKQTGIPKSLQEFVGNIPGPDEIRAHIEENRREKTFLRQLLKLSQAKHAAAPKTEAETKDASA